MNQSGHKRLTGRISLRDPEQAQWLFGDLDLIYAPTEGEVAEGSSYRASITPLYGFYPPRGQNELVVYAGGGFPFVHAKSLQPFSAALGIQSQAHPKTHDSNDSPQVYRGRDFTPLPFYTLGARYCHIRGGHR